MLPVKNEKGDELRQSKENGSITYIFEIQLDK